MSDLEIRLARTEASVRRWRAVTAVVFALVILSLIVRPLWTSAPAPALPASAQFVSLSAGHIKVELLEVVDGKGNRVASIQEGAGGGMLMINSATPKDHVVIISATPYGADVEVSLQRAPRQFGSLKIMDGKPYLQLLEDGDRTHRKFFQAPLYSDDGNIAEPYSFTSATARIGPPPSTAPSP